MNTFMPLLDIKWFKEMTLFFIETILKNLGIAIVMEQYSEEV